MRLSKKAASCFLDQILFFKLLGTFGVAPKVPKNSRQKNASAHQAFTHPAFLPILPAWCLRQFLTLRENTEYSSVALFVILLFGQPHYYAQARETGAHYIKLRNNREMKKSPPCSKHHYSGFLPSWIALLLLFEFGDFIF
jgi:hypothetical protein